MQGASTDVSHRSPTQDISLDAPSGLLVLHTQYAKAPEALAPRGWSKASFMIWPDPVKIWPNPLGRDARLSNVFRIVG